MFGTSIIHNVTTIITTTTTLTLTTTTTTRSNKDNRKSSRENNFAFLVFSNNTDDVVVPLQQHKRATIGTTKIATWGKSEGEVVPVVQKTGLLNKHNHSRSNLLKLSSFNLSIIALTGWRALAGGGAGAHNTVRIRELKAQLIRGLH